MYYPFVSNLDVLYNSSRGCVFFWAMLAIFAQVWITFMFIKKRIGSSNNEDVYKDNQKKEEPTTYQINNPSEKKDQNEYEKSQYDQSQKQDNQSDIKRNNDLTGSIPQSSGAAPAEDQPKSGLQKALIIFQEFLFLYVPFFAINVLNIVCIRNWPFSLVIWFLIMIPISILNLLGLYLNCENRFVQCFLRSIWVFVGVAWYLNFYTIKAPYYFLDQKGKMVE